MRVFYYSGATIPSDAAKSVHVMKMCQALGNLGHEVHLFAKGDGGEGVFSYYDVAPVFKLQLSRHVKIPLISGLARLLDIPERARNIGAPDLVYGRDPVALALFSPKNASVAFEAHQLPYLFAHRLALAALMKRASFAGVVCISEGLKQDFLKLYPDFDANKVFVAHDGADFSDNLPVPKVLDRNSAAFCAGYTGSLHPGKGGDFILKIAERCPDVDFHVIGGTREQVEQLSKRKSDNVTLYGHLPHSELAEYLQAFDVLLAPYDGKATIKTGQDISRWISPMKLFEYMAARKPIICSDLPVIREVMQDKHNGLLVPPGNVDQWVDALYRLREDASLSKGISEKAFADLKETYSWRKRAEHVLGFCV